MTGSVAVVTDSTAYLPRDLIEQFGIVVVPVQVVLGGQSFDDVVDVDSSHVAEALKSWKPVSTSRPAPAAFMHAYAQAAESGATEIVSIHLSGDMSGTVDSAEAAAQEMSMPIRVLDSRTIGMALGFAVLTAAEAAAAGQRLDVVADAAASRAAATSATFYVDTLEYLRRGGRIGAAQALLGSALAVKPLLRVVHGQIAPLEKVRTSARALSRLEELTVEQAGDRAVDVAVQHLANATRAETLAGRLRDRLPKIGRLIVGEVGAVVGAHVGPGMVSVSVAPR
ncbi:MAG: DegV family protein [Candidatus Nanopelagicales bacterium]